MTMNRRLTYSLSTLLLVAAAACQQTPPPVPPQVAERLAELTALGPKAPLTLLPVTLLGRPDANVADALGLVLERMGMSDLEVAATAFAPQKDTPWAEIPALLCAHVKTLEAKDKRYFLYGEFLGTPKTGPEQVRFVVVDANGALLIDDVQGKSDRDFKRTAGRDPDPLGCATLVGERLFARAGWSKQIGAVKDGKFQQRWQQKSGVPDKAELAQMQQRKQALRGGLAQARFVLFPTVTVAGHEDSSAERLAEACGKALELKGAAAIAATKLSFPPSSNEQKRLWDLARELRKAVLKTPIDADYALVADIGVDEHEGPHWLHLAICNKAGELVLVDMLNDQSPIFAKAKPKSLADAERLAVERLTALLR